MKRSQALGIAATGAAVYSLAPVFPPKFQGLARIAGVAATGYGLIRFLKPDPSATGGIVPGLAESFFGPPADAPAPDAIRPIEVRPLVLADFEFLQGDLDVIQVAPEMHGTVQTGLFSNDYVIRVGIVNTSDAEQAGELRLELEEDYLLSDETRTLFRNLSRVAPKSVSVFELSIGFARSYLTRPEVTGLATFKTATGELAYEVST